jgi:hypothetical protein
MGADEQAVNPGSERRWWYCLRHGRPEYGPGCPTKDRMGPYASESEAEQALQIAAARTEAWDAEDRED